MEAAARYRYPGADVRSDRAAQKVRERNKNNKKKKQWIQSRITLK